MKKIYRNKKGYSLLEMIVAIAMFATIFLMVTSIYLSLLRAQRSVIATQTIQESMKFVFELIGKEIRTAQKSNNFCESDPAFQSAFTLPLSADDNPAKKIYNIDSASLAPDDIFYFKNKDNECVAYYLEDDVDGVARLKINRDGNNMFVTPNDIDLNNLSFSVIDDDVGAFHLIQPAITIRVDVSYVGSKNMHKQTTTLQTSITSRYYE